MIVRLTQELYEYLIVYCDSRMPDEACGLIVGKQDETGIEAEAFIPVRNSSRQPRQHFEMAPDELIPALAQAAGRLVGLFHSHPAAPPVPSEEDLQTLWHEVPSYWIVSFETRSIPLLGIYQMKKTTSEPLRPIQWRISQ